MKKNNTNRADISPEEFTDLEIRPIPDKAAGVVAVKVAMQHALSQMNPIEAMQSLAKMNQKNGFDCPGCAWPDPDDKRSLLAEYCENGAKALAEEATTKRTSPDFFKENSITDLSNWSDFNLGKSGRLTHPLIKRKESDHYEEISWNDAFGVIAHHLKNLDNPNQASFYTSGRSSNEAAFLYGLFVRAFGTNNMPDCSNMCHESSGVALKKTLGIGKGSIKLDDFQHADVVIVIGQNPGTNHPRMLSALQECKRNGGKVISINPLEEVGLKKFSNPQKVSDLLTGGTDITDVHLPVKINQDVPLLKAFIKKLIDSGGKDGELDFNFINSKTSGYKALVNSLNGLKIESLLLQAGINQGTFEEAYKLIAQKKRIIICWAMGLTQHVNAIDNIKECVNLLLLKGSIGIKGGGTCPVRGHSNVQGDRSVGIMHTVSEDLNRSIRAEFGFDPPTAEGLDVVKTVQAMHDGRVKIFMALGGNFAAACSDSYYTAHAFRNCDMTVHISTKLNRTHTIPGEVSIILPTLGRSEMDMKNGKERFITVENSMGKVHPSKGHLKPASNHLKSEPEIVAHLAHHVLGERHPVDWLKLGQDYSLLREKLSRVVKGFQKLKSVGKEGFYLPNNAREADFSSLPDGRAQFSVVELPDHTMSDQEFMLMTIRSHDQFNTTIYGMNDRYRGVFNERRVIFINPEDLTAHGLSNQQVVHIQSNYKGQQRTAHNFKLISYKIPAGCIAGYFPELNPVVPIDLYARESYTPASKSVIVKILPSN